MGYIQPSDFINLEKVNEYVTICENKAYNQALKDLQNMIDCEYYDGGYGTYHEVEKIARMIEQLRK